MNLFKKMRLQLTKTNVICLWDSFTNYVIVPTAQGSGLPSKIILKADLPKKDNVEIVEVIRGFKVEYEVKQKQ